VTGNNMSTQRFLLGCMVFLGIAIGGASCGPEAGSSSSSPPPPPIIELDPPGPKDPDLAARAAVVLGSCLSDGGWYNPQIVLTDIYYAVYSSWQTFEHIERTTRCLAEKADGCAGLERCFATTVHAVESGGSCDTVCLPGNVSQICVNGSIEMVTDCSRLGMECDSGGCSTFPTQEPCDPAPADLCRDGIPRHCPAGSTYQWRGVSCVEHDLACTVIQVGENPWSLCQGTGPVCEGHFAPDDVSFGPLIGCEGTTARVCTNDREHVFDCGILADGFTCQSSVASGRVNCGLAAECDVDTTYEATCEGDEIVLCNAGRIDRIDCKAVGFEGCDPDVGLCYPSPGSQL
jgi:hypothetical protein